MMKKLAETTVNSMIAACIAVGVTVGAYQGAAAIGYYVDRPVWESEFLNFVGLSAETLISIKRRQLREIDIDIKEYQAKGMRPPGYMLERRQQLLRDIDRLEKLLQ